MTTNANPGPSTQNHLNGTPLFSRRSRPEKRAPGRILVVDDNADHCIAVAEILRDAGHVVQTATRPSDAVQMLPSFAPEALVTDVCMPEHDGFDLLETALRSDPRLGVVMITGQASVTDAVRAIRNGAEHYVAKPFDSEELVSAVDLALRRGRARKGMRPSLAGQAAAGESAATQELSARIEAAATTQSTVLIVGEPGVGKGRVAEALHRASPRASGPFVTVHCIASSPAVLESELFGQERVPEGTAMPRVGILTLADGGTLFLDGIDGIPLEVQLRLVRVLQEGRFERVGGTQTLSVDVRIVASTREDLDVLVARGKFREDLYYQLKAVTLVIPPLRARREDVLPLIEAKLAALASEAGRPAPMLSREALEILTRYEWPGNVRELENAVESAFMASRGEPIEPAHVLPSLRTRRASPESHGSVAIPGSTFADIERHAILSTYEACGQSALRTAEVLNISLRTVHYRLKEYCGLTGRRRGRPAHRTPKG